MSDKSLKAAASIILAAVENGKKVAMAVHLLDENESIFAVGILEDEDSFLENVKAVHSEVKKCRQKIN